MLLTGYHGVLKSTLRLPAICVQDVVRRLAWQRLLWLLRDHTEKKRIGEWSSALDSLVIYLKLWFPHLAVRSREQREIKLWPNNNAIISLLIKKH